MRHCIGALWPQRAAAVGRKRQQRRGHGQSSGGVFSAGARAKLVARRVRVVAAQKAAVARPSASLHPGCAPPAGLAQEASLHARATPADAVTLPSHCKSCRCSLRATRRMPIATVEVAKCKKTPLRDALVNCSPTTMQDLVQTPDQTTHPQAGDGDGIELLVAAGAVISTSPSAPVDGRSPERPQRKAARWLFLSHARVVPAGCPSRRPSVPAPAKGAPAPA